MRTLKQLKKSEFSRFVFEGKRRYSGFKMLEEKRKIQKQQNNHLLLGYNGEFQLRILTFSCQWCKVMVDEKRIWHTYGSMCVVFSPRYFAYKILFPSPQVGSQGIFMRRNFA